MKGSDVTYKRAIYLMLIAIILGMFAFYPSTAKSATGLFMVDRASSSTMVEYLESSGITITEVSIDEGGDPLIRATTAEGIKFIIMSYDCEDEFCKTFLLSGIFSKGDSDTTQEWNLKASIWNSFKIYGRAYYTSDNQMVIDMPISLWGGVSEDHIMYDIKDWLVVITRFHQFAFNQ